MRILIVDDDNNKILKIIDAIKNITSAFQIDTEIDGIGALKAMSIYKYDLLILDINLPANYNSSPSNDGGKYVLNELLRQQKVKAPSYLIAISQYPNLKNHLSSIWPFIHFDSSSTEWVNELKTILKFIQKSKLTYHETVYLKQPSIFVEGPTDEFYIKEAIRLFYPEKYDLVDVKHSSKTGASGVVRNILVWAFSMATDGKGNYIKSLGLFDGDMKGLESSEEIKKRIVNPDAAENKTFKIFLLNSKYTPHLRTLFKAGIKIPISIEELFTNKHWAYASQNNWLEQRTNLDKLISDKVPWNRVEMSLKDYLNTLNLDTNSLLYLNRVKETKKDNFRKYIQTLLPEEKLEAFQNFKPLLDQFFTHLRNPETI